jgi:nitric oxide reductase subunit B
VSTDEQWVLPEKFIRVSFWGLNIGLALMVVSSLFPGGVLQFIDVLNNGYWHARSPEFLQGKIPHMIEWLRMPGDLVFIVLGVFPLLVASILTWQTTKRISPM